MWIIRFNGGRYIRVAGMLAIAPLLNISTRASSAHSFAQGAPSTITGVVQDQFGGALANVKVGLVSAGTQRVAVPSSQDGAFQFEGLPAGEYVLEVSRPGAPTLQQRITLRSGQQMRRDITLQLLPIEERITVTDKLAEDVPRQAAGSRPAERRDCLDTPRGGCLQAPVLIRRIAPQYPGQLGSSRREGSSVLAGRIATDGSLTGLRVLTTENAEFAQAAMAAVGRWRFEPTRLNGQPVESAIMVTVDFRTRR